MSSEFDALMERSGALHTAIPRALDGIPIPDHPRAQIAAAHADIALEHGGSILLLLSTGHLNSTMPLFRVQLDCVVKSVWSLYAASDTKLLGIYKALQRGDGKEPNNIPSIKSMIEALPRDRTGSLGPMLLNLYGAAWKPLSSFVHGGLFALHERYRALPDSWYTDTLRNSNGLSTMAAMSIASGTGDPRHTEPIRNCQLEFVDCLPPLDG